MYKTVFSPMPAVSVTSATFHDLRLKSAEISNRLLASQEMEKWLLASFEGRQALFFTLTFRQGRTDRDSLETVGLTESIAREEVRRLECQIQRAILGQEFRKNRKRLAWVAAVEGGHRGKRLHAHGLVELPDGYSRWRMDGLIGNCWAKSRWSLPIREVQLAGELPARLRYISKEGVDKLVLPGKRLVR